jgi:hypothetical protein
MIYIKFFTNQFIKKFMSLEREISCKFPGPCMPQIEQCYGESLFSKFIKKNKQKKKVNLRDIFIIIINEKEFFLRQILKRMLLQALAVQHNGRQGFNYRVETHMTIYPTITIRVMIQCHLNIQLFTILPMWQGGPPLLFEFFYFLKIN